MNAPAKLAAFAGALAVLFGGGALAGGAVDPGRSGAERPAASHAGGGHDASQESASASASQTAHPGSDDRPAAARPVRGLAIAEICVRTSMQ